jgi:basic amino acid/polyamine antiporter, APA family
VMVAIAAVSILGSEKLGSSTAPMADVADKALGPSAHTLLSVIALFSTSNTVLLVLLATSRILYGMASAGTLPKVLAWIHPRRRTPWVATILVSVLGGFFLIFKDISIVAGVTDFAVFMTFVIINLSLIRLRYIEPSKRKGFRVPLSIGKFPVLPAIGALISLLMIYYLGADVVVFGIITAIVGVLVYTASKDVKVKEDELRLVHGMEYGIRSVEKKLHKIGMALRYKKT